MSCAWQTQIFWKHCFCPQNGPKWTKNRSFFKLLKNLLINSFSVWCIMKFLSFTIFLCKFHIWEKSGSWYIGRNADSQSDCKIFNYISRTRQQNGNFAFSILIQIHDNSKLILKIFGWAWSKMGVTYLVPSLKGIDGINWFFACFCKFRKTESYFNIILVGFLKNGYSCCLWSWDSVYLKK